MNKESSINEEPFIDITYEELGCYLGNKAVIPVRKDWLNSVKSSIDVHKECTKCNKHFPLEDFNNDKRRLLGKRSQCRACYKKGASKICNKKPPKEKAKEEVERKIEFKITNFNS